MCDTNAYVIEGDVETLLLESLTLIRPEGGKVYLRNLFGEERSFEGVISEVSFAKNKVLLIRQAG